MANCCYYMCCFGFCGICCRKRFVKSADFKKKTQYLKRLKEITPTDLRTMSSSTDPSDTILSKVTAVHNIPNDDFKTAEDVLKAYGLQLDEFIDSGSFAKVFKAIHLKTGVKIACKLITLPPMETVQDRRLLEMKNELYVLQRSGHPHLLRLIDHFIIVENLPSKEQTVKLYIFMQFGTNGNLSALLEKYGPFDEMQCKLWFAQILSALKFMHEKGIAHRDLKLHNILLDESNDVLISDFGLSRVVWRPSKGGLVESATYCGTPPFLAPEVLIKKEVKDDDTKKSTYNAFLVDVWAMGVILYRLFNKDYPFDVHNIPKALKKMRLKKWQFSGNNSDLPSDDLRAILKRLLEPDPSKRPTVSKVTKHEWIREVFGQVEQKNNSLMRTSSQIK